MSRFASRSMAVFRAAPVLVLVLVLGCDVAPEPDWVTASALRSSSGCDLERCCERRCRDRRCREDCMREAVHHRGQCAQPPDHHDAPDAALDGQSDIGVAGSGGAPDTADAASPTDVAGTGGAAGTGDVGGTGGTGRGCSTVITSITGPQSVSTARTRPEIDITVLNFDSAQTTTRWEATGGYVEPYLVNSSVLSATFSCLALGTFTVTVSIVSFPPLDCTPTASTTVTCLPACGDGRVEGDEQCEPPFSLNAVKCDGSCHIPSCGNGVLDLGEECDPFQVGGPRCSDDCRTAFCGNGVIDPGEQCDPPVAGLCGFTCQLVPATCGDRAVQPGEQCDPPGISPEGLRCGTDCQLLPCGNGVTDPGEQCDPPSSPGSALLCTSDCQVPRCGNRVVDSGEECDPPNFETCTSDCRSIPIACGNGVRQQFEQCDSAATSFCRPNCGFTTCGSCVALVCGFTCGGDPGPDLSNCQLLEDCVHRNFCQTQFGRLRSDCFCSDSACSLGPDGVCGPQLAAAFKTSDGAELTSLIASSPQLLRLATQTDCVWSRGCGFPCSQPDQ